METSNLKTLKIMPRNLNEIVRSWIRLQLSIFPPLYFSLSRFGQQWINSLLLAPSFDGGKKTFQKENGTFLTKTTV